MSFQPFVQALNLSCPLGNSQHFADAVSDGDEQKGDLENNPTRVLQPSPLTRRQYPVYRLGPEDASQEMVCGDDYRRRY